MSKQNEINDKEFAIEQGLRDIDLPKNYIKKQKRMD